MNSKGMRIVLIEDDPVQRKVWTHVLDQVADIYRTYWVDVFSCPNEACQSIQQDNKVAAIITDYDLGSDKKTGLDVYKLVKYGLGKDIPFMITSAHKDILDGFKEPKIHKLYKPIDFPEAKEQICQMIEERLSDIKWAKLEDNVDEIKKTLQAHCEKEENQLFFKINLFLMNWIKKILKKLVGA